MVFGGCYASLSRRSSKPSLPSLTCAPCLLPRKISAAISASHQENGRTKTQSGKLAPMGGEPSRAPPAHSPSRHEYYRKREFRGTRMRESGQALLEDGHAV